MSAPTTGQDRPLAGILCLCIGLMFFSAQDGLFKLLADRYSVFQILGMRSVTVVPVMIAILMWMHGAKGFRSNYPKLQLLRAVLIFAAFTCFYITVSTIPLVDAVTLYSAAPLLITALAAPILKEKVGLHRWGAVTFGFGGVLVMLQPGSSVFQPVALFGLLSAFFYACATTITRRMGQSESPALMALISNLGFLLGCSAGLILTAQLDPQTAEQFPALFTPYQDPPPAELLILLATGLVTLGGFLLVPRAYQLAPVSVVSPFEYTYLLWALLIGLVFFEEYPSLSTCIGAGMVIVAGLYIARREARLRRASTASSSN